jgi:four helix bundle protein
MSLFKSFEEVMAWQRARGLTREIYAMSATGSFAKDFGLRDQMRCAAVSVMSNIAEGFERGGSVEFARFLRMAKGSLGEINAQLYVAFDQGYLSKEKFADLQANVMETNRFVGGLIRHLKSKSPRRQSTYS